MVFTPICRLATLLLALACCVCSLRPAPVPVGTDFSGRRAYQHVEKLVELGPRPAGSAAGKRAHDYIRQELERLGLEVRVDEFTASTPIGDRTFRNVIGILTGSSRDVIAIGSHYDTKYFPGERFVGANDGGSSTGAVLELARALSGRKHSFTYWFLFFDGEEAFDEWSPIDSLYGSRHLVDQLRRDGDLGRLKALVLLDMIGDRQLRLRQDENSARWLVRLLWKAARDLGYGAHFVEESLAIEDDHIPFVQAGVAAVDLIDLDYPFWHTPDDTLDKVSAESLEVVGKVVLSALPAIEAYLKAEK